MTVDQCISILKRVKRQIGGKTNLFFIESTEGRNFRIVENLKIDVVQLGEGTDRFSPPVCGIIPMDEVLDEEYLGGLV